MGILLTDAAKEADFSKLIVARPTPLEAAIARHKAAYAAFLDTVEDEESVRAGTIEFAALEEVARAPVASDAEALLKIRYLFEVERDQYGNEPSMTEAFGAVAVGLEHLFPGGDE